MAENPASVTDLTARSLRTLTDIEQQVGTTLLGDAWTILTSSLPSLSSRLDTDTDTDTGALSALVVQVECAMVLRVLNNPDGMLQQSVDDYTMRLDASRSTGSLYMSDLERSLLVDSGGPSDGAFTIRPAGFTPSSAGWCGW